MRILEPEVAPGIIDVIDEIGAPSTDGSNFDSRVCWLCADGRLVMVRDMVDRHLQCTISMLTFTKRVEARGVFDQTGKQIAYWSRMQWAAFLELEMSKRGQA